MKSLRSSSLSVIALLATAVLSHGQVISIQFDGDGTALGSSDAAGVVSVPNWNTESPNSGSGITGLVDSTGATVANVTLEYNSAYNVPGPTPPPTPTTEQVLYSSHLESPYSAGTTGPVDTNRVSVYLTNIPYLTYNVYVYTRNQGSPAAIFASSLDLYTSNADIASNSVSQTYTDVQNTDSYVLGDNYVEFTGLTSSNLFLLDSQPDLDGGAGLNSGIAGVQIQEVGGGAVPEPSTWMMMGCGLALLAVGYRRRLKTRA